jgi:hypothetical protein
MEKLPLRSFGTTDEYEGSIPSLVTKYKANIGGPAGISNDENVLDADQAFYK